MLGDGWGHVLAGVALLAVGAVVGAVMHLRARRRETMVDQALTEEAERRHAESDGTLSLEELKARPNL